MKNLLMALIVLVFATPIFAQNGVVKVTINGIENTNGVVRIGVYNSKTNFPIFGKELKGIIITPKTKGSVNYTFTNLPNGIYAIAAWHDKNENEKIDTNLFGVPTENYGFSKNIYGTFGPPNFEEVSFKVKNQKIVKLTINLE